LGLDVARFTADIDRNRYQRIVQADKDEGIQLGVDGTPTFFINGKMVVGAPSLERLRSLVATELNSLGTAIDVASAPPSSGSVALVQERIPGHSRNERISDDATKSIPATIELASPTEGSEAAPIVVIWYSDFESQLTAKAYMRVQELLANYPGKIRVVFKNCPLPFHTQAMLAHEVAMVASAHGKFWQMTDMIVAHSNALSKDQLVSYGRQMGLDSGTLLEDLRQHRYLQRVEADVNEAKQLGIAGVPVFLVNGQRLDGIPPLALFRQVIDAELQKNGTAALSQSKSQQ
jgi:protein-disulfide isomerase